METEENSINLKLQDIYQAPFAAFKETYINGDEVETAFPMLIGVQDSYETAKYKIMICGQETNKWGYEIKGKDNITIEKIVSIYKWWTTKEKYRPTYWNFIKKTKDALRKELREEGLIQNNNQIKFAYSNVVKIGKKKKAGYNQEVFDWSMKNFNTLYKEIEILQPDLILFLSGNSYDSKIQDQLGKFSSTVINSEIQLTKLSFADKNLPVAYKCYHPCYLQRHKGWKDKTIQMLCQTILTELK